MAELTIWTWLLFLTQLFFYVSCASVIAASFLLPFFDKKDIQIDFQYFLVKYGQWMSLFGLLAVILNFLLSVGAFTESGFTGMFDTTMFSITWASSLGSVASYRLLAFCTLFFCFFFSVKPYVPLRLMYYKKNIISIFTISAFYLLVSSFSNSGHSVELSLILRYILSLHVFLVMLWIGSLYPLYKACYQLPSQQLYQLMHSFGKYAAWLVGMLIASGLTVLYFLLHSVDDFLKTIYGRWFLAKLIVVLLILLIAMRHKFSLVPRIQKSNISKHHLIKSIQLEMVLILAVLLITFIVSTLVGPEHGKH